MQQLESENEKRCLEAFQQLQTHLEAYDKFFI